VLGRARAGDFELVWDDHTRAETETVVRKIPPIDWEDFRDLFEEEHRYEGGVHPEEFSDTVPDATDRKFAALAKATDATLISNDDDLLTNREQVGIWIDRPGEFLDYVDE
jgi:predicted nucleic acid-binding protein